MSGIASIFTLTFCPVRMQAIPVAAEADEAPGDLRDPLGEDPHRPVRAVVHKYPDRVLFLAAAHCATYCRHCTRRRITGGEEEAFDRASAEEGIAYVRAHPAVRDVIVSGGDPLSLGDERLAWLLGELRAIPHVQVLRLATRAPVVASLKLSKRDREAAAEGRLQVREVSSLWAARNPPVPMVFSSAVGLPRSSTNVASTVLVTSR